MGVLMGVPTTTDKVIWGRAHSNGYMAVVRLQPNGRFYAGEGAPPDAVRETHYRPDVRDVDHAKALADGFAHAGCDGARCGRWTAM